MRVKKVKEKEDLLRGSLVGDYSWLLFLTTAAKEK